MQIYVYIQIHKYGTDGRRNVLQQIPHTFITRLVPGIDARQREQAIWFQWGMYVAWGPFY